MSATQSFPTPSFLLRLGPFLAILAALCAAPPAAATDDAPHVTAQAAATRWLCWDNRDTTLHCRVAAAPADTLPAADDDPSLAGRPDLYPRRGPLPPIVNTIHERPGRLAGRTIIIPMFSNPEEVAFAEQLARAVMCAGRAGCEVEFLRSMAAVALLVEDDPALD